MREQRAGFGKIVSYFYVFEENFSCSAAGLKITVAALYASLISIFLGNVLNKMLLLNISQNNNYFMSGIQTRYLTAQMTCVQ
jgi:hypothetical protein